MIRGSNRAVLWVFVLSLGLAIGACKKQAPTAAENGGLTRLRVGYNNGSLNRELILETGRAQGIFARHKLEVVDQGYSVGGQVAQDLAAGQIDVGLLGISPSLAAIGQGADIVVVSSQTKNNAPLVAHKDIVAIADLDGKKVGSPGVSSIQETLLNYLEKKHSIKTTHVYGKAPDLVGYLEKGEIQAFVGWEPIGARAVEALDGAHYLLDTVIEGAEASEITVSGKLLRERHEVVVRFLRAMEEIRLDIIENREARMKVAATKASLSEGVVAEGVRRSNLFLSDMHLNMDSVRFYATQDIANGKLRGLTIEGLDDFLKKAIDTTALEEALRAPK